VGFVNPVNVINPLPISARLALKFWWIIFKKGIGPTFERWLRYSEDKMAQMFDAFPNIWRMLNIYFEWISESVAIMISWPFEGVEVLVLEFLAEEKLGSKLMTVKGAIQGFFACQRELYQTVSTFQESDVTNRMITWLGKTFWRYFKKFKLLLKLLKVKDEAELVRVLLASYKGKFVFLRRFIFVLFILIVIVWAGFLISTIALLINFQTFWNHTLSQDSRRKYIRAGESKGRRHRVNRRPGPDSPIPIVRP
jgi:hypothetical protein